MPGQRGVWDVPIKSHNNFWERSEIEALYPLWVLVHMAAQVFETSADVLPRIDILRNPD
jgi:hypothetical protein